MQETQVQFLHWEADITQTGQASEAGQLLLLLLLSRFSRVRLCVTP